MTLRKYSVRADSYDERDHIRPPQATSLPTAVDFRPECPPVYDQGQIGSCTANAWAGLVEFWLMKEKKTNFMPSRLFIYWYERVIEGDTGTDGGAQVRDGAKVLSKQGVCKETSWPYKQADLFKTPPATLNAAASETKLSNYQRLDNSVLLNLKECLASGNPFVFGFTVYSSFESEQVAKTGIVPMPSHSDSVLGGHAVMCVGYNDATQMFICRNSWGVEWGLNGYFEIPYAYLNNTKLASDFWTTTAVT